MYPSELLTTTIIKEEFDYKKTLLIIISVELSIVIDSEDPLALSLIRVSVVTVQKCGDFWELGS